MSERSGFRWKPFAIKVCVAVTLAAVLLAVGEGVSYAFLRRRVGYYTYEYQSYVLWRVVPGGKIHADKDGLRLTLHSECDSPALTVWMFGGSGLWGNYVTDAETIPSYLAALYEHSGRKACVRNFGQRGWSNTQEIIKLMLELKRAEKKPDIVVFFDGSVDVDLPRESDQPDVHMGFLRFKQKFENWQPGREAGFGYLTSTNTFRALRWAAEQWGINPGAQAASLPSAAELSSMSERTRQNYAKNIELVGALAAHYGFRYVFLLEPLLVDVDKPLSPAERSLLEGRQASTPAAISTWTAGYELLRTADLPHFVNLRDVFKGHAEELFLDPSHVNAEGHQLIAHRIFDILQPMSP